MAWDACREKVTGTLNRILVEVEVAPVVADLLGSVSVLKGAAIQCKLRLL
jgi:hypothetical protein